MSDHQTPALHCPVCHATTRLYDVVDFNKSCEEQKGRFLALADFPIYYSRCDNCQFTFAAEMYQWSHQDFKERVYNQEYANVDPDYEKTRPEFFSHFLLDIFKETTQIRHLDYGGGNGYLSARLQQHGWDSVSYDPFVDAELDVHTLGQFNLITVFEVFEHVADVDKLIRNLAQLRSAEGLIVFSTLFSDDHLTPSSRMHWWYAAPRNGHISLFSKKSITIIAQQQQWQFGSFNHNIHLFFSTIPAWAAHLFNDG